MRTLLRRLFNVLAALSLLLCAAGAVLWVRSYWAMDWVAWMDQSGRIGAASSRGDVAWFRQRVEAGRAKFWADRPAEDFGWHYGDGEPVDLNAARPARLERDVSFLGVRYGEYHGSNYQATTLVFPMWLPTALLAAPPACWTFLAVRRRRAGRRLALNLCPSCGYDLRATPDRCPECGAVPPPLATPGATP